MNFSTTDEKIVIEDLSDFNIKHILDCGQVFRYRNTGDCYTLFAKNFNCLLRNEKDRVIIETKQVDFFVDYFDLNRDYSEIKKNLVDRFSVQKEAVDFGYGIRLLNQDPYEMIVSFIISANNNIPRIKGIVERLCEGLGDRTEYGYAFPTLEQMVGAEKSFFTSIGAGYRDEYLYRASRQLMDMDLEEIARADTDTARRALTTLMGVGKKVADCILLFGFKKTDLFPMDVWSKRIYDSLGYPPDEDIGRMGKRLVDTFGEYAGYAQQYLYYYYRENNIIDNKKQKK